MALKTKIAKLHTVIFNSQEEGTSMTSFKTRDKALEWANRAAKELSPVTQDYMELADATRGQMSIEVLETDLVEYFEVPDGN